MRSCCYLGLAAVVLDFLQSGLTPSLQSLSRPGAVVLVCGLACSGLSLPALDPVSFGFVPPVRSPAQSDFAALVPDSLHPGSSVPIRSSIRLGILLLATDFLDLGPLTFLRSPSHLGLALSVSGLGCPGFLMLAPDLVHMGSASTARSPARLGTAAPVPDSLHPEVPSSPHSACCSDPTLSALDFLHLDALLPLRSLGRLDLASLAFGNARIGFSLPVLDPALCDSPLLVRSFAYMELAVLVSDYLRLGLILLPRGFMHAGLAALVPGLTRSDFVFSLSVADSARPGLPALLQSLGRMEPSALALDFLHPETLPLPQSHA